MRFVKFVFRLSAAIHGVGGAILVFMVLLTIADIGLRAFGKPIFGAYELISLAGGFVVGFAIPYTSWRRGHVYVDVFTTKLSKGRRNVMDFATRLLGIGLFLLLGWNFTTMAVTFYSKSEVTACLHVPYYPVAFGLAVSCFIQSLLLLADIVKIRRGEYE